MNKVTIFLGALLISVSLAHWTLNQAEVESTVTMEEIEALADNETGCTQYHPDGCHSGGPGSKACTIDASFHACIGGAGGGCHIECNQGYYSCCGFSCRCI